MPKTDEGDPIEADEVIDLDSSAKRPLGEPADCPECGGPGFLASINLRQEVQHECCRACRHTWTTSFAELAPRI